MRLARLVFFLIAATTLCGQLSLQAQEKDSSASDVVYAIPIRGAIEPALLYVIRRGVSEALDQNAEAVIFTMDTPGGTVNAAREIVRIIQSLEIPTYTFVENHAFSAGAIIAMATDHIYMAPGTVIGDAMPIMMSPFGGAQEMPEDIREKTVSAVAALIRSAAESGGHDPELAEAMVRRELEYSVDGEVISPKGQLLTLTNLEAERRIGEDQRPLLSLGTVADVQELLQVIGLENAEIREMEVTAAERIARFIAALAPLFLIGGLIGLYIEIRTPGFGIPGLLGIVFLAIFFWGHHIAGLAGAEDLLIFALGAALLMVELFLIPGFGVIGFAGVALMLLGILNSMVRRFPGGPVIPPWTDVAGPLLVLLGSLIATAAIAGILGRYVLPRTQLFNRLVLAGATSRAAGYAAAEDTSSLVGLAGRAITPLRPAGAGMFGNRRLDVITRGDYIDNGSPIVIVETHGNRIIVELSGNETPGGQH